MRPRIISILISILLAISLNACSLFHTSNTETTSLLKVGVSSHYNPLAFREHDELQGLEIDFARSLAQELGKELVIKEYRWELLFNALEDREIDIIMSGVSITEERTQRFYFALPYTQIAQMAVIRSQDAQHLAPPEALHSGNYVVGYSVGTTGESYVQNNHTGKSAGFKTNIEGVAALRQGKIDYFVHDAPTIWNLANGSNGSGTSDLLGLYRPLTQESLAWVLNTKELTLANEVNSILERWKNNGYLNQVIKKWIPVRVFVGEPLPSKQ